MSISISLEILIIFVKNLYFVYLCYYFIAILLYMSPEQPVSWGLNIDQMLQTLATQPKTMTTNEAVISSVLPVSQQQQVLQPSFSIESLAKPTSPVESYTSQTQWVASSTVSWSVSLIPKRLKMVWSAVATLLIVVIGAWVVSIQYPLETKAYMDKIFGVIGSVAMVTNNNIQPSTILVDVASTTWIQEVHSVAPENYVGDSPLADAMAQSQDLLTQDTPTENVLDTVMGDVPTVTSWDTGFQVTPSSSSIELNLPTAVQSTINLELEAKLTALSQSSEIAMKNLIGNSDVKMAKMRAVYKTSQSLLAQFSDKSFVPDNVFRDQIDKIQSLYDLTIAQ